MATGARSNIVDNDGQYASGQTAHDRQVATSIQICLYLWTFIIALATKIKVACFCALPITDHARSQLHW